MKKISLFISTLFLTSPFTFGQNKQVADSAFADKIIAMEKTALDAWNNGDPDGYLRIYAADYTYFDPFLEKRIDSFAAIKEVYEAIRGQVSVSRYDMVNPVVQTGKDIAILTFNLHSYSGDTVYKWNCTEVFKQQPDKEWKIIHTHWSFVRPMDMVK